MYVCYAVNSHVSFQSCSNVIAKSDIQLLFSFGGLVHFSTYGSRPTF